ncbi:MAG: DNA-directed RNA polymerase subunit RPC12/RpoP [Flavobacteriales bacterium]|jgi:DNA-directed RNA polymerase subunit RPC12/RpoP
MALVTLRTFDTVVDAHILRTKLESEGITCYLIDEHTVGVNPLFNITVGGIKLNIDETDAPAAIAIIEEIEGTPFTDGNDKAIACPKCKSENIYSNFKSFKGLKGIISFTTSFLLAVFPKYYKAKYKCKDCGEEFKATQ